jgi:hypothetical protein
MHLIKTGKGATKSTPSRQMRACIFMLASLFAFHSAESAPSLEYKVKAAYVFKLLSFVEWEAATNPQSSNSVTNICVVGDDPIKEAIQLLNNKTVKGRTISIDQKHLNDSLADCHIVFVTRAEASHLDEILLKVDSRVNLTISDIKGFAELGGMVELAIVEDKVKLVINRKKVNESAIQFSSKLMGVAKLIDNNDISARTQ